VPGRVQTNRSGRPLLRYSAPVPVCLCVGCCDGLSFDPARFLHRLCRPFSCSSSRPPLSPLFSLSASAAAARIWRVFRPVLDVCLVIAGRVRCMCAVRCTRGRACLCPPRLGPWASPVLCLCLRLCLCRCRMLLAAEPRVRPLAAPVLASPFFSSVMLLLLLSGRSERPRSCAPFPCRLGSPLPFGF
jgi:hypothetical protein